MFQKRYRNLFIDNEEDFKLFQQKQQRLSTQYSQSNIIQRNNRQKKYSVGKNSQHKEFFDIQIQRKKNQRISKENYLPQITSSYSRQKKKDSYAGNYRNSLQKDNNRYQNQQNKEDLLFGLKPHQSIYTDEQIKFFYQRKKKGNNPTFKSSFNHGSFNKSINKSKNINQKKKYGHRMSESLGTSLLLPSFKRNIKKVSYEVDVDLIVGRESRLRTQMGNNLQETLQLKSFVGQFITDQQYQIFIEKNKNNKQKVQQFWNSIKRRAEAQKNNKERKSRLTRLLTYQINIFQI